MTTYVATADPHHIFTGHIGVDQTRDGEFVTDVWAGPLAAADDHAWDVALAAGGWQRLTGWESREGYWTADVRRAS